MTTTHRPLYAGLFIITSATLMYEILLTRIFSVTMWYHFAFVAISVAMFGMTVGALIVYLCPQYFSEEKAKQHMAASALLFALTIVISFLAHLRIPFAPFERSFAWFSLLALNYMVIALPFVFSGVCVCLALTKFPRRISRMYAADLAGAALGCIGLIYVLRATDGPTAVIAVGFLAALGAVFFAGGDGNKRVRKTAVVTLVILGAFVIINTVAYNRSAPLIRLIWIKGKIDRERPLLDRWNSHSRITVSGDPSQKVAPFGWGLSDVYPKDRRVPQLMLRIDASAATPITGFDGDWNEVEHLKYDVTNVVHYMRRDADVLAVGVGGGRDVLSALAFEQNSVLGIEINKEIISATNNTFGAFTGHLDRHPRVRFVNDEARSYVERHDRSFDIIQISLIDTWAATAAGAFALSENSLYTIEAWDLFLKRLSTDGILSVSRWFFRGAPGEMYRVTALAAAALAKQGIDNPRTHMMVVRRMYQPEGGGVPDGVGTMLVSRTPFSEDDVKTLHDVADRLAFDVVLSPRFALDDTFERLGDGDIDEAVAKNPLNISPPTDDNPFFFHMLRVRDVLSPSLWRQGHSSFNLKAVSVLVALLVVVVILTILCILVPLMFTRRSLDVATAMPLIVYFAAIGFGFMQIEISQMQRLIIFLGHPTYGLSVVLFAMLLSSSIGSLLTDNTRKEALRRTGQVRLALLVVVLVVFALLTPAALERFRGATTVVRVIVATIVLFPIGLLMGMAFPLGMKAAESRGGRALTPWLWGTNGATSVCASVLAVIVSLAFGIQLSFAVGCGFYVIAFAAFLWAVRN